jgi:hypothetical protein
MPLAGLLAGVALLAAACGGTEGAVADADADPRGDATSSAEEASVGADPTGSNDERPADEPSADDAEEGTTEPDTAPDDGGAPTEEDAAAAAGADDGTWHALLVTGADGEVTLDKVDLLLGDDAIAAMEADGVERDEALDPIYVRNASGVLRVLAVADDATVRVLDCADGCEPVPGAVGDIPAAALVEVTVADGAVVALTEVHMA